MTFVVTFTSSALRLGLHDRSSGIDAAAVSGIDSDTDQYAARANVEIAACHFEGDDVLLTSDTDFASEMGEGIAGQYGCHPVFESLTDEAGTGPK